MSFLSRIKGNKWFWIGLVVVVLTAGFFVFGRKGDVATSAVVKRQDVVRTVSVTGKTKAKQYVDMAFDQSGKISLVGAQVGDSVSAGQVLVALDQGEARARIASAQANLAYEWAKLNDAQVSLDDAEKNLKDKLKNSYAVASDAINNRVDKFFYSPKSSTPLFGVSFVDGNTNVSIDPLIGANEKIKLSELRRSVELSLIEWQKEVPVSTDAEIVSALVLAEKNLAKTASLIDNVALAVNTFKTNDYAYGATIDSYKTSVATARSSINTAISELNAAEQAWNTARLAAASASGAGEESTQSAQIKQAAAQVALDEAGLAKLSLKAPFAGLVTKQEARVGEAAQAGTVLVSLITPGAFEIDANVPEVDIGQVMVGQGVTVTIDAFAEESFTGKVTYIEPAETIIDGVVNYKIKIAFDQADERLKNGLTANVAITTLDKPNVLTLPSYFVIENASTTMVKKMIGKETVETPVMVGVKGGNGLIEIISGLAEGDEVAAP